MPLFSKQIEIYLKITFCWYGSLYEYRYAKADQTDWRM